MPRIIHLPNEPIRPFLSGVGVADNNSRAVGREHQTAGAQIDGHVGYTPDSAASEQPARRCGNVSLRDLSQTGSSYSFLDVTVDLSAERLTRGAAEIKLRPKSFQVLRYLTERAGRLVTRAELLEAIWPDVAVTDESLTKCIADIRKALRDDSQQVIRTVARRGYVLTAPVTRILDVRRQIEREIDHGLAAVPQSSQSHQHQMGGAEIKWRAPRLSRAWAAGLAALGLAAGIAAVVVWLAARAEHRTAPATVDFIQVTNFTDAAFSPALSSDGRMLTFIRGQGQDTLGGKGDIFIKLLPDGEPVQLTRDGKNKMNPAFTPSGDRVIYAYPSLMTDPQNWTTWTVSVFGGEPKLLLPNASALTWIPGASPRLLFSRVDTGTHMSIVTSTENGTQSRTVYKPSAPNAMAHRSYLSPDRKHVLVVEMNNGWEPCRLVPFEAAGHEEPGVRLGRSVGPSPGQCSGAAWSPDGRWMYFSVNTGNGYHIWRQPFPEGEPEQVTSGATEEREISFDPDGKSFVTSVGTQQSTLWIHDARGERQITYEGYASTPRFSPDGRRLYYLLRSRANRRYVSGELWAANLAAGTRERLFPELLLADYSLSSDGARMLLAAIADDGETNIWLATLDGRTPPRRLSTVNADRAFFGADGEVIFFNTDQRGGRFLHRINEDGSNLRKAIPDPIIWVYDVSPGGELAAVWRGTGVEVLPLHGGPGVTASSVCAAAGGENRGTTPFCVSWSVNRKFLYLNDRTAGKVYALSIPPRRNLPPLPAGGFASPEQAAAWPGMRIIHEPSAFFGSDPSVYAFFRVNTQRNIYRVRVPDDGE
jgi:DNA-binding winged helix-turn-helix (wHTH) protein/Tol biopolymer transport system component